MNSIFRNWSKSFSFTGLIWNRAEVMSNPLNYTKSNVYNKDFAVGFFRRV